MLNKKIIALTILIIGLMAVSVVSASEDAGQMNISSNRGMVDDNL